MINPTINRSQSPADSPTLDGLGHTDGPGETPLPHVVVAGDHADDDGQAIDDMFLANPQGAEYIEAVKWPVYPDLSPDDTKPTVTRLLVRNIPVGQLRTSALTFSALADPVQVLPADPNRRYLRVSCRQNIQFLALASPAVATNFSYSMDSSDAISLESFRFTIISDATVASRIILFELRDLALTGLIALTNAQTVVTASQSFVYQYAKNLIVDTGGSSAIRTGYIPNELPLFTGNFAGRPNAQNLQAGDQFSNIVIGYRDGRFRVAGEKSDVYGAPDYERDSVYESTEHTGPVWVYAPWSSPASIQVESVTS